jgi:hypothetical protein
MPRSLSALHRARSHDPGRQWTLQLYAQLLPQLAELPPSTLASLSRCLVAWEASPTERWLAAYWRALEVASGDMYAESILQVAAAAALRGMRPPAVLLQKLSLAAERMLDDCSAEMQVGGARGQLAAGAMACCCCTYRWRQSVRM